MCLCGFKVKDASWKLENLLLSKHTRKCRVWFLKRQACEIPIGVPRVIDLKTDFKLGNLKLNKPFRYDSQENELQIALCGNRYSLVPGDFI